MNILTDHDDPEDRNQDKVSSNSLELQKLTESRNHHPLHNYKFILIPIILILLSGLGILSSVLLKKIEPNNDFYKELQYNLQVKTKITTKINDSNMTSTDNFKVTLFGLDMEGEKYRLLVSKGFFESSPDVKPLYSDPSEIFIYLEARSKDGKILLSKYKNSSIDETTVNLLSGIIQYFVVDQESAWNYSSECKEADSDGQACTYNSKKIDEDALIYNKFEKSDDHDIDDDLKYEHNASTRVNKDGKVEQVVMIGKFEKVLSTGNDSRKIEFYIEAYVEVLSISKLSKSQLKELNQIARQLPPNNFNKIYKKKINNEFNEEPQDALGDEEIPECFKVKNSQRMLSSVSHEGTRGLLKEKTSYKLLKIYDKKYYLKSKLTSDKDENDIKWLCSKHKFTFSSLKIKVLKEEVCISSQNAKNVTRTKLSKYVYKGSVDGYVATIIVGSFTIDLNAEIKVKNIPFLESIQGSKTSSSILTIESISNITIYGITKSASSSVGGYLTNNLTSNIIVSVTGNKSPFSASLSADTAYQGNSVIWMKNIYTKAKCYSMFGIKFCLPEIKQDNKNYTFAASQKQDRSAQISIFTGEF